MSRPRSVSGYLLEREEKLRQRITEILGHPVSSLPVCRELANRIQQLTGEPISYNTIRRFFNLLPGKQVQPNAHTIRILENFVLNYNSSLHIRKSEEVWLRLLTSDSEDILQEAAALSSQDHQMARSLLQQALLSDAGSRDKKILRSLFQQDWLFDSASIDSCCVIMQGFGVLLNRMQSGTRKALLEEIAPLPTARRYYFEWFPDLDQAGEMIDFRLPLYKKFEKQQDLFPELFSWHAASLELSENGKQNMKEVLRLQPDADWHPVLLGRFYAVQRCC